MPEIFRPLSPQETRAQAGLTDPVWPGPDPDEVRPGLARLARAARKLGNPQDRFPAVLVAGTNGKGSVAHHLHSALLTAGYRTGLYTSPHLHRYTERIRLGGREIGPGEFQAVLRAAREAARASRTNLTEFEGLTLAAFLAFARFRSDLAVVEVGLGGRWDSTNLLGRVELTVITNVGLDHTQWLGPTLARIALEKAGILRARVPAVTAATGEALSVIKAQARRAGAPLLVNGRDFEARPLRTDWRVGTQEVLFMERGAPARRVRFPLLGSHQVENAAVALAALAALGRSGYRPPSGTSRPPLARTRWPGRFECVRLGSEDRPLRLILDGAHNPAGAASLAKTLAESPWRSRRLPFLFGCLGDKDAEGMIRHLAPHAGRVYAVRVPSARSRPSAQVARLWARRGKPVRTFERPGDALAALRREANGLPAVAAGSLYLIGELRRLAAGAVVPE